MFKKISSSIIVLLSIAVLEVVGFVTLFVLYANNAYDLQTTLDISWVFISIIIVLLVDTLAYLICVSVISKHRSENNLSISKLFGENVEYSLDFAGVGIAAVNEENKIIWVNQFLNIVDSELMDKNILDEFPTLRNLQGSDSYETTISIKINDRYFSACYLQSARIYLFKDTTEYDNQVEFSKQQQMVLGVIKIDNLSEIAGADNSDDNDIIALARTTINEYFRKKAVLLRRINSDSYFIVCNYNSLSVLEDDGFSILDDIKNVKNDAGYSLTISVGIAHDYDGSQKLNERAFEALDMAISRGGDQVVVDRRDTDLKFYGGKTEALEKKNKIKVRLYANSLVSTLKLNKERGEVFIMGHKNADLDAIGSALGVLAICETLGVKARVVFDLRSVEEKTKIATTASFTREEFNQKFISSKEAIERVRSNTALVCVDFNASNLAMSEELLNKCSKVLVIDHHRANENKIDNPIYYYVDPSASSASELVTELLYYSPLNPAVNLPAKYATIILSGIFLDTTFFRSSTTGARTFEACMVLRKYGADNVLADDFLKDNYEEKELINSIIDTIQFPYQGVAYCIVKNDVVERQVLAKVSEEVMRIKGVSACFTIGALDTNVVGISCRSDGSINVQLISENLGGGGHFTKAAVQLNDVSVSQAETMLLEELTENLEKARSSAD